MGAFPSTRRRRARGLLAAACGAAAIAITAAACGSSGSSGNGGAAATPTGGTPVTGGTATYALPPNTVPNYIFPFDSSTYFSVVNSEYFQYLMYRPLYWFGNGASPTLNSEPQPGRPAGLQRQQDHDPHEGLEVVQRGADHLPDVLFWIHMLQAVGASDWGAYVPGGFPTNVSDIKAVNATTVTMTMNKAYNPTWFTSNELSQITPMPQAWDRTASGPSDCTTKVSDCSAVYTYLDSQSKDLSGWTGSPLWSVVDGPWKLTAFNSDGNATFVPNANYGGSKAHLAEFQEVPFTTESAEYNVLQASGAGGGNQKIDVGYMPTIDAPTKGQRHHRTQPGQRLLPRPAVLVGDQLLPGQLPVHHRQRRGHQAAVLPRGAAAGDEPGGGDRWAAQGVRPADGRPGRQLPGDQLPVRQGQAGRPVPV